MWCRYEGGGGRAPAATTTLRLGGWLWTRCFRSRAVLDRLLRLRAEMKLPGKAWLEFEAVALGDGRSRLTQSAFFEPRGLFGLLYWYAVLPFHALIFGGMASRIALFNHAADRDSLR